MFKQGKKASRAATLDLREMGAPFRAFLQVSGKGMFPRGWWRSREFATREAAEKFGLGHYREHADVTCWVVVGADQDVERVLRTHDLIGTGPAVWGDIQ